jgi:hypothetical protein
MWVRAERAEKFEGGRMEEEAQPTRPPPQRYFVFIRVNSW